MTITLDNLPALDGTSFEAARQWLAKVRPHESGVYFRGFHADDLVYSHPSIDEAAIGEINRIRLRMLENSRGWADSSVLYDLWGDKKVEAERLWPGFVNDVWTSGSRTGYVSVRGRSLPNYIIEEYSGEFFLLEFDRIGPASECPSFKLSQLDGVKFVSNVAKGYLDTTAAEIIDGSTVEFENLSSVDDIIADIHNREMGPRPKLPRP